MPGDYLPHSADELAEWMRNFYTVAVANQAETGLTQAQLDALDAATAALEDQNTAYNAAQNQIKIIRETRDDQIADNTELVRSTVAMVQAAPDMTNGIRGAMRISLRDQPRQRHSAITPTMLIAIPEANGTNHLTWKANGNTSGTLYVVQAKKSSDTEFKDIFVSTVTRYDHTGQAVGESITYRVAARRGNDDLSDPSNEASVYG